MAKFKHIALASQEPGKTATFYKEAFGLVELSRIPEDPDPDTVWLSDGDIYFNIFRLKARGEDDSQEGGKTAAGIHHIGFHVEEELQEACEAVERANGSRCGGVQGLAKFKGPDGVIIDVMHSSWDERIKAFER